MDKQSYEAPAITEYGDLVALTEAGSPYGNADANYSVGDPLGGGGGDSSVPG